ncbi:MAG: helix-turn-helix transcriptional regulator [Candidatus Coproplasma sp.]
MNLSNFSDRLSYLMFEEGINGRVFAKKIGCGTATIYRYLNATKMPSVEMVVRIADYFKVTTDFLLGLEADSYSDTFLPCPPFNERFAELLKQCAKSQYSLEKETGISHSVVGYWKSGKTTPTIESVIKIANALNRTVDFVLGREA